MNTMQVIEISAPGGPEVLRPARRPRPEPGDQQILIRVHAAGVNRPDLMQRAGHYPPPPDASDLPGLEVSGVIEAVGARVQGWRPGDPVCALCNGGGYAEYVAVPAGQCLPVPQGLDWVSAAALPETFFTVWINVFQRAGLAHGESLLVHGGTSGIGTTAIQMATAFGATVYATAGSADKVAACERLGAARGIDYHREDFVAVIREATGGRGVDVILDMIGGDYFPRNLACLADDGRLAQIAFMHDRNVNLDLSQMMLRRLHLSGSTLRPLSAGQKAAAAAELRARVWPKIGPDGIRPVIDTQWPLAQAAEAHRRLEEGSHIGKMVLTIGA